MLRLMGVLLQATRAALLAHFGAVARLLAGFLQVFCAERGRLLHTFARPVRQQVCAVTTMKFAERFLHTWALYSLALSATPPPPPPLPPVWPGQESESSNLLHLLGIDPTAGADG